jgi:Fe-S-cluster-containing hydrogenase component 2
MSEERLPVVDTEKCTGCGICVRACPRGIISLLPAHCTTYLGCSSHYRGKSVKNICSVGCIGCGLCARKDPNGAIEMVDNLPVLDFEKAGGDFTQAAEACPTNSYVVEVKDAAEEDAAAPERQAQPA